MRAARATFDVMGTRAEVIVDDDDGGADAVAAACLHLAALERLWSRFDPNSEVSCLNRQAGEAVRVSPATFALLDLSQCAFHATGGAFDPTVLGAMLRAGYDRTFEQITEASARDAGSDLGPGAAGLVVDRDRHTVRLPEGVGIDPGGIGKGLAADLVIDALLTAGARGAGVNIGGDARVAGVAPDGATWAFDVENPWDHSPLATVHLAEGAIATSTTTTRAWVQTGRGRHHLIDPVTGSPVENGIASVTVLASRGWQADVLTKAVFVTGITRGFALVDGLGAAAFAATQDGQCFESERWGDFTRTV
jgi:FAD:protein FMN transferase